MGFKPFRPVGLRHHESGTLAGVRAADVVCPERVLDVEVAAVPAAVLDVEGNVHQGLGVADVARDGGQGVGVEELHAVAALVVQVGAGEELLDGRCVADHDEVLDVGDGGGAGHSYPFSKIGWNAL